MAEVVVKADKAVLAVKVVKAEAETLEYLFIVME